MELTDSFIDRLEGLEANARAHFVGDEDRQWTDVELTHFYTDGGELLATEHDGRPTRFVKRAYRNLLESLEFENDRFYLQFLDRRIELKPLPNGFFER